MREDKVCDLYSKHRRIEIEKFEVLMPDGDGGLDGSRKVGEKEEKKNLRNFIIFFGNLLIDLFNNL